MRNLLVEVLYTVDLAGCVDGERYSVETLAADDTHEAERVEWLARRSQDLHGKQGRALTL